MLASTINPIPDNPTFSNYSEVLGSAQFPRFMLNSAILSAIGAFGTILVAAPAAYAFSRIDFAGRRRLLLGVLALQMISPLVLAFPLYRYFASLGLLNNLPATGLVYVAVLMPLATWMLKGFFDGIPSELDEAAMIDGANRWRGVHARSCCRSRGPGLTAVFVIMALLAWAEFVIPYILLTGPSHLPIAVGILNFQGTYATNATGILAAGSVHRRAAGDPALRGAAALHRRRVHRRRAEGLGRTRGCPRPGGRSAVRVLARLRRPGRRPSTRPSSRSTASQCCSSRSAVGYMTVSASGLSGPSAPALRSTGSATHSPIIGMWPARKIGHAASSRRARFCAISSGSSPVPER